MFFMKEIFNKLVLFFKDILKYQVFKYLKEESYCQRKILAVNRQ